MFEMKFRTKIFKLMLMLTMSYLYGCIGGGGGGTAEEGGVDPSRFNIKISMQNPNDAKVYGVYLKLDYGGVKVTGSKKALTVSNNPRGGTSWDKTERVINSGAEDKMWWHNSGDGILHLKGEGMQGMNEVFYSIDGNEWLAVDGNINAIFTPPASGENLFSLDLNLKNSGLVLGKHDVKVQYSDKGNKSEIPAEFFKLLDSEGVEISPSGITPSDSIVIANDSYIESVDSSTNTIFMKIGLIHYEGFSGTGEILVLPVKIVGDKNKISIKDALVIDKEGNELKASSSGITFSINIDN